MMTANSQTAEYSLTRKNKVSLTNLLRTDCVSIAKGAYGALG